MRNNAAHVYSLFLVVGDFLALVAAFVVAYVLRFKVFNDGTVAKIPGHTFAYTILAVLPLWLVIHAFIGLYNQDVYEKRFQELGRLFIGSFLGILTFIGYDFMTQGKLFPGFAFLVLFRTFARMIRRILFRYGFGISNVLIIGDTVASEQIANSIDDTRRSGLRILGMVGKNMPEYTYFRSFHEAIENLQELPHGIIQTELYKTQELNDEVLRYAQEHHIAYRFVPGNNDLFVGNIDVELFDGLPMIAVHQTALIGWGRVVKRLFDMLFASIALIIASPFMLLIDLSIRVFDPRGPILFRQKRLTRFNREFQVYKFRTTKQEYTGISPEEAFEKMGKPKLAEVYRTNGDFLPHDPRISSIGRFLRRTSLDELPQLFNVLRGDISLVGPRALVPEELNEYEKRHTILSVKSGLTGLAQISGRRDIGFEERRKIDMYYVQNWSFWLDISIILRTLRVVITGSGAK
jgi:exopolysaccharide biosynthesis polyprenyl glycosylphosphotransferase